jgi:CBS domain-containing protein
LVVEANLKLVTSSDSHPSLSRPRVILIQQYGELVGLVTIKDILRYQLEVEHDHAATAHGPLGPYDLEALLEELRDFLAQRLSRISAVFSSGRGGGSGRRRTGVALSLSSSSHVRLPQEEEEGDEVVFDAGRGSGEDIELRG